MFGYLLDASPSHRPSSPEKLVRVGWASFFRFIEQLRPESLVETDLPEERDR